MVNVEFSFVFLFLSINVCFEFFFLLLILFYAAKFDQFRYQFNVDENKTLLGYKNKHKTRNKIII